METRPRPVLTALLVLVAVGGAGLAVAADRPHHPDQRPELTWAADQAAQPWIVAAQAQLGTVEEHATTASAAGRDALASLQAFDLARVRESLTDGAEASLAADEAVAGLTGIQARSHSAIERWRLGQATADRLDRIDTAAASANGIVPLWVRVEDRATIVAELIDLLTRHDAQVFRATTAGRQGQWSAALTELEAAAPLLAEARDIRDRLAPVATVETLTDLLDRYGAYDAALLALYEYVNETGMRSGDEFDAFEAEVERAQSALPSDNGVLSVIVGEAAGGAIAEALVQLEQVRGDILAALLDDDAGLQ